MAAKKAPLLKDILSNASALDKRLVPTISDLKILISKLRGEGFKIALAQGVWDLLHEGHAKYLELAKSHADILVVGVDSDELTRLRKGPRRPIVPEKERLNMLAHLRHVDVLFLRQKKHGMSEQDQVLRAVNPDVLIVSKSTTTMTKDIVRGMRKHCGEIQFLEPQSTTSTSARIRLLTIDGAKELSQKISVLIRDFLDSI